MNILLLALTLYLLLRETGCFKHFRVVFIKLDITRRFTGDKTTHASVELAMSPWQRHNRTRKVILTGDIKTNACEK